MATQSLMTVGLALLAGFGAPVADKVEIRFAPAEGLLVKKEWAQKHKLTLQALSTQLGSDAPVNMPVGGQLESTQSLSVTDDYVRSEENRPARLRRTFDDLSAVAKMTINAGQDEYERNARLDSKLKGLGVQFSWVPEDQNYGKFYFAADGREGDLAELGEDFDLRCVLPTGAVAVGSSWSVDPARLADLVAPCGELRLRAGKSMDLGLARGLRNGMGGGLESAFGGRTARAEFTVTLKELRDVDGEQVAVLAVAFRGNFLNENTEFKVEDVLPREAVRGARPDRTQISLELNGKGEVLWSLTQGRALSMSLASSQIASLKIVEKLADGKDMIQTLSMRGTLATTFTTAQAASK